MRIIVSISSEIGYWLAKDWLSKGHKVSGTYRTWSSNCDELVRLGVEMQFCDLTNQESIADAVGKLKLVSDWDSLVLGAGDQNPIGLFGDVSFVEWKESLEVNFVGHMQFLHGLMKFKTEQNKVRSVIFFAGGGTNNATERYSAYTISKIASIKMCELLDFEYLNYKFTSVGPGWVKSKIHHSTVLAKERAGKNYQKTIDMQSRGFESPVSRVVECCNWILSADKSVVGGRNFSVVNDAWGSDALQEKLKQEDNMYKLRRFGNDIRVQ